MGEKGPEEQSLEEAYFEAFDDYADARARMKTVTRQTRPDFDPATLKLRRDDRWVFTDSSGTEWVWHEADSEWIASDPSGKIDFERVPWSGASPETIARDEGIAPGIDEPEVPLKVEESLNHPDRTPEERVFMRAEYLKAVSTQRQTEWRREREHQGLPPFGPAAPMTRASSIWQLQGANTTGDPKS